MRRALPAFLAGCLALSAFAAAAQDWPKKTIHIVVPFPSGGTTDTAVRPLADRLSQQLGVSVVVDNKPGAAGRIGYEFAARAAPDGYTLLAGTDSLGLQPHLEPPPNYDPIRDFAAIGQLSSQPLVIAVHPSLGVTTLQQLVELGRTKREPIGYATSGIGSSQNFAGEWFARVSGLKMLHVPYRGGGQAGERSPGRSGPARGPGDRAADPVSEVGPDPHPGGDHRGEVAGSSRRAHAEGAGLRRRRRSVDGPAGAGQGAACHPRTTQC